MTSLQKRWQTRLRHSRIVLSHKALLCVLASLFHALSNLLTEPAPTQIKSQELDTRLETTYPSNSYVCVSHMCAATRCPKVPHWKKEPGHHCVCVLAAGRRWHPTSSGDAPANHTTNWLKSHVPRKNKIKTYVGSKTSFSQFILPLILTITILAGSRVWGSNQWKTRTGTSISTLETSST